MNELTWRRVLEWEALHHDTCGDPKLLRFMGKPHDLRYKSSIAAVNISYTCASNIACACIRMRVWHCALVAVISL